ncbi:hypothetical protein ACSBR2_020346 [Camellia fascicularis]
MYWECAPKTYNSYMSCLDEKDLLLTLGYLEMLTYSYFPIKTQFRIITVCCLLHNLIQREMPMDLDDDENEEMNPPLPATELGDEMIDVIETFDQWSEWRTALATQMFNE